MNGRFLALDCQRYVSTMYWIFGAAAGVSGALYFLLNLIWPGWYLDYIYFRSNMRIGAALQEYIPKNKMLPDIFEDKVKQTPKKTFLIYDDKPFTYEYVDKKANQVARALIEMGAGTGSTVAILIHSRPSFVWTLIGKIMF